MKYFFTVLSLFVLCGAIANAQIISAGSGNWDVGATWVGGVVPGASDNVVIANGHTVTINVNATVASLTVGEGVSGVLTFKTTGTDTLTVTGNLTIASGASFVVPTQIVTTGNTTLSSTTISGMGSTAGLAVGMNIGGVGIPAGATIASIADGSTITISVAATAAGTGVTIAAGYDNALFVGGNLTNNGTFDMSNGYSAGVCSTTFNNDAGDQTLSGAGTTTRFAQINVNKGTLANKVSATINASCATIAYTAGTWEQSAGRISASSTVNIGSATLRSCALNIIGSGSAAFASSLAVYDTLLVNTSDSVLVGSGANNFNMTVASGYKATFTAGTVVVYGKMTSQSIGSLTVNGANIIIDPKNAGTTDYAFRTTTGGGTTPFVFSSGTITILNPNPNSTTNEELNLNSSIAASITGTATFILGNGAATTASPRGFRLNIQTVTALNHLVVNTGSVDVVLSTKAVNGNGTLTLLSSGTLSSNPSGFSWTFPRYVFGGTSAQVTGAIMPASVKTVVINNPANVTSSQSLTITDTLYLISGQLLGPFTVTGVTTGVDDPATGTPTAFAVAQNYPNPFNPSTTISFSLDKAGFTSLRVYDMLGRLVGTVIAGKLPAGSHKAVWNASGRSGGTYFYTLQSGDKVQTRKMVLLK